MVQRQGTHKAETGSALHGQPSTSHVPQEMLVMEHGWLKYRLHVVLRIAF